MKIVPFICLFALLLYPFTAETLNKDLLQEPLKNALTQIDEKRAIDAINTISRFSPDSSSLAIYHYIYAKAYSQLGNVHSAMEHFRLAYIYSNEKSTKELILFERANTYANNKYYDEATLCFRIFLRQFPESKLREEAFIGLAESLYNLGKFNEAFLFFQKGGNSFRSLYGKADSLHAAGRIKEAHELYLDLINNDKGYPKSQLSLYNIGENFRLMNKFSIAKVYFAMVKDYPLRYKAELSNGLIAFAEGKTDKAVKHFELAMQSPDRGVKRKAILYLSEVSMKNDKMQEAKARLIEIRNKYPYGKDYDEAIRRLALINKNEKNYYEAASLLRELVFRKNPDKAALDELEILIIEAKNRNKEDFIKLWKIAGQWLLEPSRSEFIASIVRDLKPLGKEYLNVCEWLLKHGSERGKMLGNLLLAEFYVEMGVISASQKYLQNIKTTNQNDDINRINAKFLNLKGELEKSLLTLNLINNPSVDDAILFINISSQMSPTIKNQQNLANFLESALKKIQNEPRLNMELADVFYQLGKKQEALQQYKTAITINEKNKGLSSRDVDWCFYRISLLSGKNEAEELTKTLQKGNDYVNRFARAKSKENILNERMKGLF